MKRSFLLIVLSFVLAFNVSGEPQDVLKHCLQSSDTVCVATVTAIDDLHISFSVSHVIKGKLEKTLEFQEMERPDIKTSFFTVNSEWLLISTNVKGKNIRVGSGADTSWVAAMSWRYKSRWPPSFDGEFLSGEIGNTTCLTLRDVETLAGLSPSSH